MSEHKLKTFHDQTKGYKCIANTTSLIRQSYSFFVTFVVYLIIGVALIFIYNRITKHLNMSVRAVSSVKDKKRNKSWEFESINPVEGDDS